MYGLLLAALLALDPCAQLRDLPDAAAPKSERVAQQQPIQNRRIKTESQAEGERRLGKLASIGADEQQWLFAPQEGKWYEAGYGGTKTSVHPDTKFLLEQYRTHEHLILEHQHPAERRFGQTWQPTRQAFPGFGDLNNIVVGSVAFYGVQPNGEYEERAISTYGIASYRLTPLGRTCFSTLWRKAPAFSDILQKRLLDAPSRLNEQEKALENPYIEIRFQPW